MDYIYNLYEYCVFFFNIYLWEGPWGMHCDLQVLWNNIWAVNFGDLKPVLLEFYHFNTRKSEWAFIRGSAIIWRTTALQNLESEVINL